MVLLQKLSDKKWIVAVENRSHGAGLVHKPIIRHLLTEKKGLRNTYWADLARSPVSVRFEYWKNSFGEFIKSLYGYVGRVTAIQAQSSCWLNYGPVLASAGDKELLNINAGLRQLPACRQKKRGSGG